jgi:hypothetical protein
LKRANKEEDNDGDEAADDELRVDAGALLFNGTAVAGEVVKR